MKKWIVPGLIMLFAVIGLILIIVRPDTTPEDADSKPSTFGADMAFSFDCKGKTPSAQAIQQFMTDKGFKVLDKVAAGKKLNPDFSWMKMDIVGMDSTRRQISFKAFADQPDDYHVSLYSEPPTQHDKGLEDSLQEFTKKTLACKTHKVSHLDNPAGAKDLYDRSVGTTESWFQQAAGMPPTAATTATPTTSTK
jgi:hypothetical protein